MTAEFLAKRRAEMPPYLYRVHFENKAAEVAAGIFSGEWLEAAKARGRELHLSNPITADQWGRLTSTYGRMLAAVGLDRALAITERHDRTVATILARPQRGFAAGAAPVFVLAVHVLPQGHSGADILRTLKGYQQRFGRINALAADVYQMADLAKALRTALHIRERYCLLLHETQAIQTQAFGVLGEHLRNGRLILGEGESTDYLCRELGNLRARLNARLDAATFVGYPHDDSAHSAALACYALSTLRERDTAPLGAEDAEELYRALEIGQRTGDWHDLAVIERRLAAQRRSEARFRRAMTPNLRRW